MVPTRLLALLLLLPPILALPPGPVYPPEVVQRTFTELTLRWDAAGDGGGDPVTAYQVHRRVYDALDVTPFNAAGGASAATQTVVAPLDPETLYEFKVEVRLPPPLPPP